MNYKSVHRRLDAIEAALDQVAEARARDRAAISSKDAARAYFESLKSIESIESIENTPLPEGWSDNMTVVEASEKYLQFIRDGHRERAKRFKR
jgi:hypothetical protein